ncbi:universal stress protein UspA [Reticulibacter mediterranei]|uniref:Universal stress protein UspA n=1 Tax=Reticulibacter mediterranei TaxID=2778369 RepID=A0A8J3ISF3_9CHLR|nr:universal stress protein [Reticulibacter mediterranei]GHO99941.1 universal stress protein UspA [Reticulibacter mediterranei]
MFQRILVPLDGSTHAERALPVALRLVRASGGSLLLLRAVNTATDFWPFVPDKASLVQTAVGSEETEARQYLAHVLVTLHEPDLAVETVVQVGPAASTILAEATSLQADLIVMCSRGSTSLVRLLMGSVTREVARHSTVPVLVLREGAPLPAGPHPDVGRPMRVLVPLDGSSHAKAALVSAASLAMALAAPAPPALHLTRVVKPLPTNHEQDEVYLERTRMFQRTKEYLQRTAEHLREGWSVPEFAHVAPIITWSVVPDADVAAAILRVAETGEDTEGVSPFGGCDVIAMSTHGYSGLSLLTIGSITEHVLNASNLPLLIVRPTPHTDGKPADWMKTTLDAFPV